MINGPKLAKYAKLWVGFSGGLDSTVLLHLLVSSPLLVNKVAAVHVHHGVSPNALEWQTHCEAVSKALNIPLSIHHIKPNSSSNLEDTLRQARYKIFRELVQSNEALLLGHHAADQAETLLLQLFRGAGIDGAAGMRDKNPFARGVLLRPLLTFERAVLEDYAKANHLVWVEDESNLDCQYARNFLRHQIMPLLKTRWPKLNKNLARSAEHFQAASENLQVLAAADVATLKTAKLPLKSLYSLATSRLNNVLRAWIKANGVKAPSSIILERLQTELIFASKDRQPEVSFGEVKVRRFKDELYLLKNNKDAPLQEVSWTHFPKVLEMNQQVLIAELADAGLLVPENAHVSIRYRVPGQTIKYRSQTKSLKKLFQEWQVPPWVRDETPLLYINGRLAAIVGYAIGDDFYHKPGYQITLTTNKVLDTILC